MAVANWSATILPYLWYRMRCRRGCRVWRVFAGTAVRRFLLGVNFRVSIIDSTARSTTLSTILIFVADFFRYPEIVVIAPTTFYSRFFL